MKALWLMVVGKTVLSQPSASVFVSSFMSSNASLSKGALATKRWKRSIVLYSVLKLHKTSDITLIAFVSMM